MERINLGKVVPERGVDYWTQADQQAIIQTVENDINISQVNANIATLQIESGHTIEMSLNSTTYVLTLSLKNKAGTVLNTETIDLPNENALTDITYSNGILTLTKQNGTTSTVDISGLISGLQLQITSSNKLSSDLVDDTNKTNKFVTSQEKNDWSAKYTKPSGGIPKTDLASDVQASLNKADSALQEHQDISGKEDNSNKVTELTDESTDTEYPSAKAVYDELESVKAENEVLKSEVENQQKILSQMPKVTGEGTEFTMENTIEAEFAEFLPGGNTEQETTTGKNKLGGNATNTSRGMTTTISENIITVTGTTAGKWWTGVSGNINIPAGNVALSIQKALPFSITFILTLQDETTENLTISKGNLSATSSISSNAVSYQINFASATENTTYNETIEMQLELNSVVTSYEPYTGGIASPNVDYPQERYSAGANGSITEKIYYDLKQNPTVLNALLAISGGTLESNNYEKTLYVPCKPNRTYKIQKNAGSRLRVDERSAVPTTGSANVNLQYSDTASSLNYTTSSSANYLLISFYNTSRDTISQEEMLASIKIEDVAITQTYTIPVQQEMRDIKDSNGNVIVEDEFIEEDGVKYERHNVARVVFDGTEGWTVEQSAGMKRFNHTFSDLYYYNGRGEYAKSNYFHSTTESEYGAIMTYQSRVMIYVSETITTVEQFKAWIAQQYANGTPVYVDYILKEPTDLPCTQEQIDVLENLPETYAEQTNVLSEDSVPANVKASGLLDLNTLLNAIVALGGNM